MSFTLRLAVVLVAVAATVVIGGLGKTGRAVVMLVLTGLLADLLLNRWDESKGNGRS